MPSTQNLIKTALPCVFTSATHTRVCIHVIKNLYTSTTYILHWINVYASIQKQKVACLRGKDVKFPFTTYARIIYILYHMRNCRWSSSRVETNSVSWFIKDLHVLYRVRGSTCHTHIYIHRRSSSDEANWISCLAYNVVNTASRTVELPSNTIRHERYTYICMYAYTHTEVV